MTRCIILFNVANTLAMIASVGELVYSAQSGQKNTNVALTDG